MSPPQNSSKEREHRIGYLPYLPLTQRPGERTWVTLQDAIPEESSSDDELSVYLPRLPTSLKLCGIGGFASNADMHCDKQSSRS